MARLDLLTANDHQGTYPPSWYTATARPTHLHGTLRGSATADVCVIGGGYTGLSAALHLAEAGYSVILLEANRVGWGASGRNGGQIGSGQRRDQDWLEREAGLTRAHAFWDMAEEAKSLVRSLIARHGIDCDLKPGVIHADHKQRFVAETHAYAEKLARDYNYTEITRLDRDALAALIGSSAYHGGSLDRGAGHLHPLNYALGLAEAAAAAGVRIHESSRATEIGPPVRTKDGDVRASHILIACNGYLGDLEPNSAARIMPINNFIVATEPLAEPLIPGDQAVADSRFVVNYWRMTPDNRLLFGGGESYGYKFPPDIAALVGPRLRAIYPKLAKVRLTHAWGGTLAITVNRMPAFLRMRGDVYSAGGYSGHGVALATLAGKLLTEAVRASTERFDLFANLPQRPFPGGDLLRGPLLTLAMTWYTLRDRL